MTSIQPELQVCPKKLIKDSNVENLPDPKVEPVNGPAV